MRATRRRFRFSLFSALAFFTVICVGLAAFVNNRIRAIAQQNAIANLAESTDSNGGLGIRKAYCYYDFQIDSYRAIRTGLIRSMESRTLLADWFGIDQVQSIAAVDFQVVADAEALQNLSHFPGLEEVGLYHGLLDQDAWDQLVTNVQLKSIEVRLDRASSPDLKTAKEESGTPDDQPPTSTPIQCRGLSQLLGLKDFVVSGSRLSESNLDLITEAENIRTLRLLNVGIEFTELASFPRMENLENFFWNFQAFDRMDNERFRFVERMPNLMKLAIAGENTITDVAFGSLEKLNRLQELSLHRTAIEGWGIGRLRTLPLLKLELGASHLNDAGLAEIAKLEQLTHLELGSTKISDEGMKSIAKLKQLKHLSIRDTRISDAGLVHLGVLKNLRFLRIRDTNISDTGVEKFRKSLPGCVIDRN